MCVSVEDSRGPCEKLTRLCNRLPSDGACVGYGSDNAGKTTTENMYMFVTSSDVTN